VLLGKLCSDPKLLIKELLLGMLEVKGSYPMKTYLVSGLAVLALLFTVAGGASAQVCDPSTVGTFRYPPVADRPYTGFAFPYDYIEVQIESEEQCQCNGSCDWTPTGSFRHQIYDRTSCTLLGTGPVNLIPTTNGFCPIFRMRGPSRELLLGTTPVFEQENCSLLVTFYKFANGGGFLGDAYPITPRC
ncbi:MAG: hypothetical protein KDD70_09820, partial [Bdellovibrionales bacterium]|nr:hypothetical protein [Bdellovibrionales bacterium]